MNTNNWINELHNREPSNFDFFFEGDYLYL